MMLYAKYVTIRRLAADGSGFDLPNRSVSADPVILS